MSHHFEMCKWLGDRAATVSHPLAAPLGVCSPSPLRDRQRGIKPRSMSAKAQELQLPQNSRHRAVANGGDGGAPAAYSPSMLSPYRAGHANSPVFARHLTASRLIGVGASPFSKSDAGDRTALIKALVHTYVSQTQ